MIRIYDRQGRHLRTAGGRGEGPGRFGRFAGPLCERADGKVAAADPGQRRVHTFSARGEHLSTTRIEGEVAVHPLACFGDGSWLAVSRSSNPVPGVPIRRTTRAPHGFPVPGARPGVFDVFDPDGVWLGSVTLPPDLRVLQMGADYVLGVAADDLGVQEVRLHRITDRTETPG